MKRFVSISLMIFVVVVAGIFVFSSVDKTKVNQTQAKTNINQSELTQTSVSKHISSSDCWLIIKDKVYDVSTYINSHPGGSEAITSYCGKDATIAFETKGGSGSHSSNAYSILDGYYIGDLTK